jgi:glucose uptake protein GlcU
MNNIQSNKNNSNLKYIIIGVVAVVAILVGVFILSSLNKGSESNDGSQTLSKSTYDVNFKGFKFKIPDNLVYELSDGVLKIGDEANTWAAQVELESGSYAQIKNNMGQLQSKFQSLGYTSSAAVEKTVSNTNFITMEVSMSGTNAILAIAKANSMYFMGITTMNQNNEYDYSVLNTIAPIVSSVTYVGETNNIEANIDIDFNSISGLAQ